MTALEVDYRPSAMFTQGLLSFTEISVKKKIQKEVTFFIFAKRRIQYIDRSR